MKKVHYLLAAAMLMAGAANAQRAGFAAVNACIGCPEVSSTIRTAGQSNPNPASTYSGSATIDNCSLVVQGQAAGAPSTDRGNDNVAVVDQSGTRNTAALYQREGNTNYGLQVQTGTGHQAGASVYGDNNTTVQLQRGTNNRATINVDQVYGSFDPRSTKNGNRNLAQQRQEGAGGSDAMDNNADIKQYGNDNLASQDQIGNSNSASIYQHTNSSRATQRQAGNNNTAQTYQGVSNMMAGNPNPSGPGNVPATAAESFQRSCIDQGGNNNSAYVAQDHR